MSEPVGADLPVARDGEGQLSMDALRSPAAVTSLAIRIRRNDSGFYAIGSGRFGQQCIDKGAKLALVFFVRFTGGRTWKRGVNAVHFAFAVDKDRRRERDDAVQHRQDVIAGRARSISGEQHLVFDTVE